jgi:CheY-like chemotaxis protein
MSYSAPKCALIVDDSRTARQVLGQMLMKHHIKVEAAESAEKALEFLRHSRPDVIFMDHMMPGMDGLQAVRAIKENPATATIPIMMYTSQAGELYVGQARALGAVGVLPKQIQPVQVLEMLESLHLLPASETNNDLKISTRLSDVDVKTTLEDVERMIEPADWGELHGWFEEMLHHHEDALSRKIEDSVARLLSETAEKSGVGASQDAPAAGQRWRSPSGATNMLVIAVALMATGFFWFYLDSQERWQELYEQNVNLLAVLDSSAPSATIGETPDVGIERNAVMDQFAETISQLEFAVNQYGAYGMNEIPLDDRRLEIVEGVVRRLRTLGFIGVVQIESHVGDFCGIDSGDGGVSLAAPELQVTDCEHIGMSAEEALALSGQQSVAFANYVAALEGGQSNGVRINIQTFGNVSPAYAYPAVSPDSTAGEWNRIAQLNHRVQIRLISAAERSTAENFMPSR